MVFVPSFTKHEKLVLPGKLQESGEGEMGKLIEIYLEMVNLA